MIDLKGLDDSPASQNYIYSTAVIDNAGGLTETVHSALYAASGAVINLDADMNHLYTWADSGSSVLERVVWAYDTADINISGAVSIATDYYFESFDTGDDGTVEKANSKDLAIVAGTATALSKEQVAADVEDRSEVNITYKNQADGSHSVISGDILSAYTGQVEIRSADEEAGIDITGNLLAGNNGIMTVDLGAGGTLTGRIDDYGDAGAEDLDGSHEALTFFNAQFSSEIYQGGEVNLIMGAGSRWDVTGQSWVTSIKTGEYISDTDLYDDDGLLISSLEIGNTIPVIDLTAVHEVLNTKSHALTIYNFDGDAMFNMTLDRDRSVSDMLYIKQADGTYLINLTTGVSVEDMYAGDFNGLRFATVGAGSNATFVVGTYQNGGVFNNTYTVATDSYDGNAENEAYNGSETSAEKPGNDLVDSFFAAETESAADAPETQNASESTPEAANASFIAPMMLTAAPAADPAAEEPENKVQTTALATRSADNNTVIRNSVESSDETLNFKVVSLEYSEVADAGKTLIDMSRANYAAAVYLDTLNKRLGEARFVGDQDGGLWVRLRHDNIGKEHSFRNHSTMFELGIDRRDKVDSGEFHTGFALDYMNGDIDYHNAHGDGDLERCGIWLYTTWLADDGQYLDLMFKYAHLRNDFDVRLDGTGVMLDGDYSNDVFSLSAEYGWKFANAQNLFIEPQVQLQYAYVTSADYTTSHGTDVDLDAINSLIGRAGFRAGKDFLDQDHPVSLYLRADVLHEFLGDQDITAKDDTGVLDVTYENDDTWYSIGLGVSVQSSENSYFFLEGEQLFGADHDSSYIFTGGFKYSF
ncbi:MAG: autotransporter outer membrane beta-barrel domain-containing protein [Proteobacteria bacterium]|uniref:Autotransporter outer membrane beta-barrel domain-containing protein n=1 Tax=Candidatus Avisuccinivibrio stercorigallinarum TaxID=2840704 RepID=A0A9D9GSK4_9GAMM|nr:autotransporter outer membrane beta-barrel domain-containing protein [Candidatus Avisuccinivibrio stercorigallinarum]